MQCIYKNRLINARSYFAIIFHPTAASNLLFIDVIFSSTYCTCTEPNTVTDSQVLFHSSSSPHTALLLCYSLLLPPYNLTKSQVLFYSSCSPYTVSLLPIDCCSPSTILPYPSPLPQLLLSIYSIAAPYRLLLPLYDITIAKSSSTAPALHIRFCPLL
jgi:hypothetical protein